MCRSSVYSLFLNLNVTGSLPSGWISVPLTAFRITLEGKRLEAFTLRRVRIVQPAAEISAPESGRTCTDVEPLGEVMLMVIVGAESVEMTCWMLDKNVFETERSLAEVGAMGLLGFLVVVGLLRHTLAKWPIFLQLLQGILYTGIEQVHLGVASTTAKTGYWWCVLFLVWSMQSSNQFLVTCKVGMLFSL